MEKNISAIETQLLVLMRQFLLEQETTRALRAISLEASFERDLGIDSLGKVELFHRIEKTFHVHFSDAIIAKTDTLAAAVQAIVIAKPTVKIAVQDFAPALNALTIDLSDVTTLQEVLIRYALSDPDRPHIYLHDDEGKEEIITYGELLTEASNVANGLLRLGVKSNDTVAIMVPTGKAFFHSFFGILLAGAIPVPIYPPFRPDRIEEYAIRETRILSNAEVRVLITFADAKMLGKILQSYIPTLIAVTTAEDLGARKGALPQIHRNENDPVLIQYTSGSTGDPKGVLLLQKNMLTNIRSFNYALELRPTDAVVSWLPLYHDMGLMSWIASLFYGIPITILSPLTFLNHPERWLWALHYHRGTIAACPNFGYELCVKKIDEELIEGLDLSSWRLAFNGAESINTSTLERFYQRYKNYGFSKTAFTPVYGLAENTVALTFPALNREPRVDRISRETLEHSHLAVPAQKHEKFIEFVCEGRPIPEHEIRIVNDQITPLPERHIGNIQFRGPSAMQGYYRNPAATAAIYHDGWWETGDLGYIADNELFITGRKKDIIIKAGRNLYPEFIEEVVGNISNVRKGCVIAFGVSDAKSGTEKIVVVLESKLQTDEEKEQLQQSIIEQLVINIGVPPDHIVIAPPQTIPKTSSGKLQRAACKQAYLQNTLTGQRKSMRWQLMKLSLSAIKNHVVRLSKKGLRFIYTLYAWCVILVTVPPVWLLALVTPRKTANILIKAWSRLFFILIFSPLHVKGKIDPSQQPCIYAANHASYADTLVLLAILPINTVFIGKKELLKTPIIASLMRKLQFLTVDRWNFTQNIDDFNTIRQAIEIKQSIAIFPEGTFTYATGLRPFKSGAFQLAAKTQVPVCPVAIKGTRTLLRGNTWLLSPSKITITLGKPLSITDEDWSSVSQLRTEVRHIIAAHCGEATIDVAAAGPEV